jgi:hypothetical protein
MGTGSLTSMSTLASHSSSSSKASTSSKDRLYLAASSRSDSVYSTKASLSIGTGLGAKRLTPNRLTPKVEIPARTSAICWASCSGVL